MATTKIYMKKSHVFNKNTWTKRGIYLHLPIFVLETQQSDPGDFQVHVAIKINKNTRNKNIILSKLNIWLM